MTRRTVDDLSEVTDVKVPGGYILSAERLREQIRWAQKNRHANCYMQLFTHNASERDVMVVIDLYDERWPTMSVTNDAENVLASMRSQIADGKPVIYRDTDGTYDELLHREGHFATFRALGVTDLDEAIELVIAMHERDWAQIS